MVLNKSTCDTSGILLCDTFARRIDLNEWNYIEKWHYYFCIHFKSIFTTYRAILKWIPFSVSPKSVAPHLRAIYEHRTSYLFNKTRKSEKWKWFDLIKQCQIECGSQMPGATIVMTIKECHYPSEIHYGTIRNGNYVLNCNRCRNRMKTLIRYTDMWSGREPRMVALATVLFYDFRYMWNHGSECVLTRRTVERFFFSSYHIINADTIDLQMA